MGKQSNPRNFLIPHLGLAPKTEIFVPPFLISLLRLFSRPDRHFSPIVLKTHLGILIALFGLVNIHASNAPVDLVSPLLGTGGSGHVYPGAVFPFGMVQLSPDTGGGPDWDHCAGYYYPDTSIIGFSLSHLSGTGCADFGDILLQPTTGSVQWNEGDPKVPRSGYRSAFSHAEEQATPGYYEVLLKDYGVKVELTATAHAGFHRYTFPASAPAHVMMDLVHGLNNQTTASSLMVENSTTISGFRRSKGWAKDKTFYFVAEFSRPFTQAVLQVNGQVVPGATQANDKSIRASLDFATDKDAVVSVRIGLSPTSVESARRNLAAEISTWDFDAIRTATNKAWNDHLSTVEISAQDPSVSRVFYTALYHSMLSPHLYNNVDGSYYGADKKTHQASFANYSTFSIWDQFRAWFPLMTLVQPGRINDQVNSMLAFYAEENQHALPVWNLAGNETWCMIGYNTTPMIATAWRAGFRGFDPNRALAAMKDTAMNPRYGQDQFHQNGYLAEDKPATSHKWASVSRTLEFSYDDYCIGVLAKAIGRTDDAATFLKYATNYRNLFDPETKFMRGRNLDGTWRKPFQPIEYYRSDYTEADAWQYSFTVPHDPQGLIDLIGGDDAFADRLDAMFSADSKMVAAVHDISGFVGQYAQGNEPVHGYAYLYAYAGQPWREAQPLRRIMALYKEGPEGMCGNDDCGQMSAWYVFGALGFYPVNPANGEYVLGSPLIDKAVIHLNSAFYPGGTFTLLVRNNSPGNIYIQSATLNNHPLDRAYLTHEDITRGGTLTLTMGSSPNKAWGRAPSVRPSSLTPSHADSKGTSQGPVRN
jgi:predicted alpha-1,2-mannosidase